MCDPATLTVMTLASGAISLYGGIQSSKAQQASLRYSAQLNDINSVYADRAARDALERGELDALAHGRTVAKLRGEQTVAAASQGLDLGFGTPLDVAQDTDVLAAEDTGRIYSNAEREAQGYRINAQGYRNQAAGDRAARANEKTSMYINAGSTILNTATQIGGQWAKYGKPSFGNKFGSASFGVGAGS